MPAGAVPLAGPGAGAGAGAGARAVPPPPIVNRTLRPGIYAPVPTFFTPDEELDLISFSKHVVRLAMAGVYPVISGSTVSLPDCIDSSALDDRLTYSLVLVQGEAPFLTPQERSSLVKSARAALQMHGLDAAPIIAGANGNSLKHSLELAIDAANAGADAAIVLPTGYFASATNTPAGKAALKEYFVELSNRSPIPILIYNFPGAAGGINMDSDFLIDLACSVTALPEFATSFPRRHPNAPFLTFTGYADTLYPALMARGAGSITGLANIFPHTVSTSQGLFPVQRLITTACYTSDPAPLRHSSREHQRRQHAAHDRGTDHTIRRGASRLCTLPAWCRRRQMGSLALQHRAGL
jgi:4-hydroxy-2-oxoglutarate aldolase